MHFGPHRVAEDDLSAESLDAI